MVNQAEQLELMKLFLEEEVCMVIYEKERVPQSLDLLGKAMNYHSCFFSTGEQTPGGRVDPTAKESDARIHPILFVLAVDALATCTTQAYSQGLLGGY